MDRTNYHVVYEKKRKLWKVRRSNSQKPSRVYKTKEQAVGKALSYCKKYQPSELHIHNKNGRVTDRRTYPRNSDPNPPKG